MKLGEALALRADLQKRMNRMQALLRENATVQEGDVPVVSATAAVVRRERLAREAAMLREVASQVRGRARTPGRGASYSKGL